MAQIICIIGNKGGTGKTTLSHMMCQGLGLLGQRSACVLTDTLRDRLLPDGRRYVTADARSKESLYKVINKLRTLPNWIGVVDGAGNRPEMDRKLYAASDFVILPFRDSLEDIRTVVRDLETFPRAYALPSQWPTNVWQREAADKSVTQWMRPYSHRILKPVNVLSSSKLLLYKRVPEHLPTPLSNACRTLGRQILDILDIAPEEEQLSSSLLMDNAEYRLAADEMPIR